MHFLDFRKYLFSYLVILVSAGIYYFVWIFYKSDFPPVTEYEMVSEGTGFAIMFGYYFLLYLITCGLLLLEMLIRKFIITKFFPNLKFPIKIKVPKIISIVYTVTFFILFFIAILPLLCFVVIYIIGLVGIAFN